MTKKQAMMHLNKLIKEKKLIFNEKDQLYEYPMAFSMTKARAMIAPEFTDHKMYKLSLVIVADDELANDETIFFQAATAYMQKYRGYTLFKKQGALDKSESELHWVKNNLHIFLHQTAEGTVVNYINTQQEKQADKDKETKSDSAKEQTSKDI
jgi:hypothetical protein